jgi:hypothetical protein
MNQHAEMTASTHADDMAQEAARCGRLWVEVLLAGIADADADKHGARAWIGSGNFLIVAELAGLDRDAARGWAAAKQEKWRTEEPK